MKKRFLIFILALFVGLPCIFTMAACKDNNDGDPAKIELNANMISLSYSYTTYNGLSQEPVVTIKSDNDVISKDNYSVSYSNNINVGTANVVVQANSDSKVIKGSASKNFTIASARANVTDFEDLNSIIDNSNYSTIVLTTDLIIPEGETLTISENVTINCGSNSIITNGTLINNGKIKADADSASRLVELFEYASHITLTEDIELNGSPIAIDAATKDYNLDLNLNGYSILGYFKIYAKTTYKANVNIRNYYKVDNINASTIGVDNDVNCQYGIAAMGNNINLSIYGVNLVGYYGGIATNGKYQGGSISATDCYFKGVSTQSGNKSSLGAYLPAKSTYSFIKCTFEGGSAYYAKSGVHSLTECEFKANLEAYEVPSYYGSGGNATGSALIVDSSKGYFTPLNVTIYNGKFNSVAGYGIEEYCSGGAEDYSTSTYHGDIEFNTAKDPIKLWESPIA